MSHTINHTYAKSFPLKVLTVVGLAVGFIATSAGAFSPNGADIKFTHPAPNGREETCIVAKRYVTDSNSILADKSFAEDREDEIKLCRMTVHAGLGGKMKIEAAPGVVLDPQPVAKEQVACSKLNSTNPGTNFVEVPKGMTHADAAKGLCVPKRKLEGEFKEDYELDAKFKSTISCSNTASALGTYHISRILGAGRVPVAVARTLDREFHETVIAQAQGILGESREAIALNWNSFSRSSAAAKAGQPNPKIYTDGGRLVYGSLQKNLKGEEKYTEVNGRGDYETRYERFISQTPFLRVANELPLDQILNDSQKEVPRNRSFNEVAPMIVQMQDVSDMVLIDTLMAQDDRIGNIHSKPMVVEINEGSVTTREISKQEKKVIEAAQEAAYLAVPKARRPSVMPSLTADLTSKISSEMFKDGKSILVRAMYLKDNDCGVDVEIRGNNMKKYGALEKLRHVRPSTYKRFMAFAEEVESDRFKTFALETLQYRPKDYERSRNSLKENVRYAVKVLRDSCRRGDLKLDLTLTFDSNGVWQRPVGVTCD